MIRKQQLIKEQPNQLRRYKSNQVLFMDIIPQITPVEPHFVRKANIQQNKARTGSLQSKKNPLDNSNIPKRQKMLFKRRSIQNPDQKIKNIQPNKKQSRPPLPKICQIKSQKNIHKKISFSQLDTQFSSQHQISYASEQNTNLSNCSSSKSVKFSVKLQEPIDMKKKQRKSKSPSILKNSSKILSGSIIGSNFTERSFSINHSFASNWKQKKIKIEQSSSNMIIKKKYENILKTLTAKNIKSKQFYNSGRKVKPIIQKYQDQIFPPVQSSIFPKNAKNLSKSTQNIQWMRISDIFPNEKLVLFQKQQKNLEVMSTLSVDSSIQKIKIIRQKDSLAGQFMVTAMNTIKNNSWLLQKIFEEQQVNQFGIYLLKIFQENTWKYVIIDDFIPVIKSNMTKNDFPYKPAFINVVSEKEQIQTKKISKFNETKQMIPIWPYLLQKAYANYYSSYQAITIGSTIQMVQQFCGLPFQKVDLVSKKDPQQYLQTIQKILRQMRNGSVMAIGYLSDKEPLTPLFYKAQYCYTLITEEELICYDPRNQYSAQSIKFYDLGSLYTHLYLFNPYKQLQSLFTIISKPKHKISAKLANRLNQFIHIDNPSIRKFTLTEHGQCSILIRQREKRLLHQIGIEYIWLRVIVIAKDYNDDYRWIDGEYSNSKIIVFNQSLQAGDYFVFFWPQWNKQKYHHQIQLSVFTNQTLQTIERHQFQNSTKVLEKACADLAQKSGKLHQINKYICSYNFLDKKTAMIIQNINNQRISGQVNIVRSIQGLKSKVEIVPLNEEFFQKIPQNQKEEGSQFLAKLKPSIDVRIQKGQSYTVMLKMKGGIDQKFFKAFDFGG